MIGWIAEYNAKYGGPPSLERLEEEFDDFVPIDLPGIFILDDIADQTIERKKLAFFVSEMSKTIDKTRVEGAIQQNDVYAIMRTIFIADDEDVAYSTYDRSKYGKRAHTKAIPFFAGVLNRAMGDLHGGDYCLVVARLGTGKSLITQWQAREWMLSGLKVLFISQEMLANEIFARIDGMVGSFNPLSLRSEITSEVGVKLQVAQLTAKSGNGEIFAPKGMKTPEQIAMAAKFFATDVVVIDGIYQLAPDLMHSPPARWERVTEVSGQLKQMAQTIKLPLLTTTQIKRVGRSEAFTPEDIAFADAIGMDADQIIALEKDPSYPTRLNMQLIKNRYGPEMATLVDLNFETMKIGEVR
jgi:predicted ATP-dependent serine protease